MEIEPKEFIQEKIRQIKNEVADKKALVATSGGVDSMTCALLAHKAIGEKAVILFIDDGLMRNSDKKRAIEELDPFGVKVEVLDAQEDFFKALKNKTDPEEKRKAFRQTFYDTLSKAVKKYNIKSLIQGTIAADIKETKGKIKTQHNILSQIGIDPEEHFGFKVLEPLRDIFKHHVREIAKELGFPKKVYTQMPFPGPGFATRIIGEVTPKKTKILRQATEIIEEEIKDLNPFQAFVVLLNDKATGVKEGRRSFGNIIVVRSVDSKDAMIATVTKVPWKTLEKIRDKIIENIPFVVKVLFDITPKPPSTIEYI